jgi:hypothetical protein
VFETYARRIVVLEAKSFDSGLDCKEFIRELALYRRSMWILPNLKHITKWEIHDYNVLNVILFLSPTLETMSFMFSPFRASEMNQTWHDLLSLIANNCPGLKTLIVDGLEWDAASGDFDDEDDPFDVLGLSARLTEVVFACTALRKVTIEGTYITITKEAWDELNRRREEDRLSLRPSF